MLQLEITWQRVVQGAETCTRCGDTGTSAKSAVDILNQELAPRGITVTYKEIALPLFAVAESNSVFFNGEAIEDLLGAHVGMNHCQSCCDLLGQQTECRTVTVDGFTYEGLPVELLVKAGRIAAEKLLAQDRASTA